LTRVKFLEKPTVNARRSLESGDAGQKILTAGEEADSPFPSNFCESPGRLHLLILGRVHVTKAAFLGPAQSFSVPLGKAHPDILDAQPSGMFSDLLEEFKVGP
jgi:hypothetical protein